MRVYLNHYYSNGPLAVFVSRHPVVSILCEVAIYSLAVVTLSHLYYYLSWIMHYLTRVLSSVAVIAGHLISWVMFGLDKLSHFVFFVSFPAVCVATLAAAMMMLIRVRRDPFERLGLSYRTLLIIKLLLAVLFGQALVYALPSSMKIIVPFLSNPLLVLMLLSVVVLLFYGLYRFVRTFGIEPAPDNICAVCLVNPKAIVIKPCRHYALCTDCVAALHDCPVCKVPMQSYERIYAT